MVKIHIDKDTATVEDDGSLVSALIAGCRGKVIVKHPLLKGGRQEFKNVKKTNAKVKEAKERW